MRRSVAWFVPLQRAMPFRYTLSSLPPAQSSVGGFSWVWCRHRRPLRLPAGCRPAAIGGWMSGSARVVGTSSAVSDKASDFGSRRIPIVVHILATYVG
jgi:hypothetical protein